MKKATFIAFLFFATNCIHAQTVTGKLKFEQGQVFQITVTTKTTIAQQAGGQAIDFTVDAAADHSYKVTNSTEENSTLNHQIQAIRFTSDGMGMKLHFDSKNEKDLNGQLGGKPMKEILEKKYDIIVDTSGKVLAALPEKFTMTNMDSRMAIITNMLKDVLDLVQPPQKGKGSFFSIFPAGAAGKGATWTTKEGANGGTRESAYVITDINDSTIVVDFAENSTTVAKAEIMGSETTTTMNNKAKGKIFLDRATGIIKEKIIDTDSNGTTEASFGSIPVTAKTNTTITVKAVTP